MWLLRNVYARNRDQPSHYCTTVWLTTKDIFLIPNGGWTIWADGIYSKQVREGVAKAGPWLTLCWQDDAFHVLLLVHFMLTVENRADAFRLCGGRETLAIEDVT